MTEDGLHETNPVAHNVIMWALTAPVIPVDGGGFGLIAGTQSNGGYFLWFEPVSSPCPTSHTTNVTSNCPRLIDTSPQVDKTLTISNLGTLQRGIWTGTPIIEYEYQWEKCGTQTGSCSPIADAEETSYTVPKGDVGDFYRIKITATNPAPTFGLVSRYLAITTASTDSTSNAPGYNQTCAPPIVVIAPGETTSPQVGDTMYAPTAAPATTLTRPTGGSTRRQPR